MIDLVTLVTRLEMTRMTRVTTLLRVLWSPKCFALQVLYCDSMTTTQRGLDLL
jgi:hypothetical protein